MGMLEDIKRDHWARDLHQQYKHLFETYDGPESDRSYYKNGDILRGIECGKGWIVHVKELLKSLEWHRTHNVPKDKTENDIKIFQIKEKFGDARVYWTCNNDSIRGMIESTVGRFEGKCSITCQICGALQYGCIRASKSGWIHCSCDDCFENRYKSDKQLSLNLENI
jgi:hypothetical protein